MCSVYDTVASGFTDAIGRVAELDAASEARVQALLDRFNLRDLATRYLPTLSFGQRRRALLARALVREPQLLILDEVFEGLDAQTRALFDQELVHLTEGGTTLLCIAHRPEDVPAYIKRHVILSAGRISPAEADRVIT